ncbi:hypothetical protein HRbin30_00816 [bacterium HR30]|nr:hypothetical protein HRbin30_00816 [bacterium HR30]
MPAKEWFSHSMFTALVPSHTTTWVNRWSWPGALVGMETRAHGSAPVVSVATDVSTAAMPPRAGRLITNVAGAMTTPPNHRRGAWQCALGSITTHVCDGNGNAPVLAPLRTSPPRWIRHQHPVATHVSGVFCGRGRPRSQGGADVASLARCRRKHGFRTPHSPSSPVKVRLAEERLAPRSGAPLYGLVPTTCGSMT